MKLTATMRPCAVWLSFFFLTNSVWGKMVQRPLALAGTQISKQILFRIQYFSATTCQNKMNIFLMTIYIVMKNARNMFSKKTLNTENHTKTVWQLPHTQAAANIAKSKPAALVKYYCADLEHRTIASPTLYHCIPNTCTIVPPTSCQCTIYIVPLHPLHRTIVPPTSYHWTPHTVPLYPLHCTIVPSTSYHCTPCIVPLYPLHRTIAPHLPYHCTSFIIPLHPYIVPLYPLRRTIVPPTSHHCIPRTAPLVPGVPASPYYCAVFSAPSHLYFAPPYLRFVPLENYHRAYLQTTCQSSAFEIW